MKLSQIRFHSSCWIRRLRSGGRAKNLSCWSWKCNAILNNFPLILRVQPSSAASLCVLETTPRTQDEAEARGEEDARCCWLARHSRTRQPQLLVLLMPFSIVFVVTVLVVVKRIARIVASEWMCGVVKVAIDVWFWACPYDRTYRQYMHRVDNNNSNNKKNKQ